MFAKVATREMGELANYLVIRYSVARELLEVYHAQTDSLHDNIICNPDDCYYRM